MRKGKPTTISRTPYSRIILARPSKSRRLFCRCSVSSPCAVIPSRSETAIPMRRDPTSSPKTRPAGLADDESWELLGTLRLYVATKFRHFDYDSGLCPSRSKPIASQARRSAIPAVHCGTGLTYFSYNQAVTFLQVLPRYSARIRTSVMSFRDRAELLNPLRPTVDEKNIVKVLPSSPLTDAVTRGFGSVSQGLFALTFIPFLI